MMPLIFVLLLSPVTDDLFSGGPITPNQAMYDTKHLHLALTIDPDAQTIAGEATLTLAVTNPALSVIELDLFKDLVISEIRVNNDLRPYKRVGHKLLIGVINVGETAVVKVVYAGPPLVAKRPPWNGGFNWSRTDSGKPWVGVSCQRFGGQVWFPCKAHPSDKIEGLSLAITVPKGLYCAANGLLVKTEDTGDHQTTYHWQSRYPIGSYNVSINIADYEILETAWRGMPVYFYVLKEYQKADQIKGDTRTYAEKKQTILKQTVAYLDFLSELFGEYPWKEEKLGIVHTNYLGMEHQTINSYGNHFKKTENYDFLLLHELSHEWWGNKVSVADWREAWIHEGFGTYVSYLYHERFSSAEAIENQLEIYYKSQGREQPVIRPKNARAADSLDNDVYYRGSLVLHSLRYLMGDKPFFKLLKDFCAEPGFVTTEGFQALAEKIHGKPLGWFFDTYLFGSGAPTVSQRTEGTVTTFQWAPISCNMPLEVIIDGPNGERTMRLNFSDGKARLELPEGRTWRLDPHRKVYKKVEVVP